LKLRARRNEEAIAREKKVYMNTDSSQNAQPFQMLKQPPIKKKNSMTKDYFSDKKEKTHEEEEEEEEEDEDDDDNEMMLAYKLEKMQMLDDHAPVFGDMTEVTAWTFENEVYKAPPNLLVIVNVFQDYLERCARMNHCLAEVAKAFPHVKFLRARSDRIGLDDYPEIGLPTLIIFQGGEQKHNLIACHELIGLPLTPFKVEKFLIEQKILSPVGYLPSKPTANSFEDTSEDTTSDHVNKKTTSGNKNRVSVNHNSSKSFKSGQNEDSDSELDID